MREAQAKTIYLKDYQAPAFLIDETHLRFELGEESTRVTSQLKMRRNPVFDDHNACPLILDGQDMELESISIDGQVLVADKYVVGEETLSISELPKAVDENGAQFLLECVTLIKPQENTSLEGLYKSKKMFCTQCEAEGFRKITYYLDRPDVMSKFTTTVEADKSRYPVLLSNGNDIARGDADNGRHWVTWEDPFRKPCYLFALVAGDLECVEDSFVTMSGKEVALRLFVEQKDLDKCDHGMLSLKNSMAWDEKVFGREYDLDIFMIVAVDDFNMGAMENKGLNIFNTSCVLANPATTTDQAFQRVEAVVAHEYFHNWSGNRVTCRDWFQLSLKEGFTVFRDSEFSADMGSRTVKRIDDVTFLRTAQFAEDAGPMAHSVRPESYMEISNFYTLTIYEKGAEVVRMIKELVGAANFRKGSDLYFDRHDGQAVTTEDFVKAMEDASGVSLKQFRNWYSQAGTPRLSVSDSYDEAAKTYTLSVAQSCPATPEQEEKLPFHIPLRMGLLDSSGKELTLNLQGSEQSEVVKELVLDVTQPSQSFVFTGVDSKPVPSLLRGFSAPVKLSFDYSLNDLVFLMSHDTDGFNRWNSAQQLSVVVMQGLLADYQAGRELKLDSRVSSAFDGIVHASIERCVEGEAQDKAAIAQLLTLPSEAYLSELAEQIDVDGIHAVREFVANTLAIELKEQFKELYKLNDVKEDYKPNADGIARRALKNVCLSYLLRSGDESYLALAQRQYEHSDNMTEVAAALRLIVNSELEGASELRSQVLENFYSKWSHEALVVDQWFSIQATSVLPGALDRVKELLQHEAFDIKNPNKVRSVIAAFCGQNPLHFHCADGSGYEFLADRIIELNKLNPQIASRLLVPLTRWKKYDEQRQQLMTAQLKRIANEDGLSKDVTEVVLKSLK
ncbi:MAG: aminopeptidase N [Pseudohongiellaceae bacterium]|nr:aminopeptidase N [Pseudohongiellaceae bacterium]